MVQDGDHRPEAGVRILWCTCDFGVQKRSHDREDPFGRKFLNSLLDTQTSFFFFFYWQYEA